MTAEINVATDEEIHLMKAVGGRVIAAEKITWTTAHLMRRRPKARATHAVLIEELHNWLADTTSMVNAIQASVLGRAAGD